MPADARKQMAFLTAGFRPFFLFAALSSFAVMLVSGLVYRGFITFAGEFDVVTWHAHEMLFGYVLAAMAGFLLTAVPNWTGRPAVSGSLLATLVCLWVIGRVSLFVSSLVGQWGVLFLVLLFPLVLAALIGREIMAAENRRNLPVVFALLVFCSAMALVHLDPLLPFSGRDLGLRLGVAVVTCLIALIGGRITPNFTNNWLKQRHINALAAPFAALDKLALAASVLVLLYWVILPEDLICGIAMLLLAGLHFWRLSRWKGLSTVNEPLLLFLHIGYAWLPLGFSLIGVSILGEGALAYSAGLHALSSGAMGTMTLVVMSRAILGHTGRPLIADQLISASLVLVAVAALMRVLAGISALPEPIFLMLSVVFWLLSFVLFLVRFSRILVRG